MLWLLTELIAFYQPSVSPTGKYWSEVVAVRTKRSQVRTKTTEGKYIFLRAARARLLNGLLHGTRAMPVLNLKAFGNKKIQRF